MTSSASPARRARQRRTALLSATMLATGLAHPAEAAMYGIVVDQVVDPLLSGLSIPASAPTQGMFSPVQSWPMNAVTLGLLPSGKVISFGTPGGSPSVQDGRTFDVWDPTAGFVGSAHATLPGIVGVNSFCAAQAFLPDGSLLVAGGIFDNGNDKGSVVLDGKASTVTALSAKLADDRYYATMITLPDGRQLIMGGSYPYNGGYADPQGSIDKGYMTGMTPEVLGSGQWSSLFGANSRDAFGPDNNRWWYPRAWVAPNNTVFGISADKMWMMNTSGTGSITTWNFKQPQFNAASATAAPNVGPTSTAVMYDTGKILQVGGNSYDNFNGFLASSLATTIDITSGTPVVADTAPMNFGRSWAQSTVLPTGQVAVTGGSLYDNQDGSNAVLQTETWDPRTGKWTLGASGAVYRGYHSTAILMQNGALLIAGGGAPGPVNNQNAEVYYPPYLFTATGGTATLAPRPSIVSLSSLIPNYAQTLKFELSSQNGLSQVVLIGLSAVTHSFNSTQRRYVASFTQSGQSVTVQMPGSASTLPPGYYQLVAIDTKGVPSPGVIVGFGGTAAPVQARTLVAATGTAANGGGSAGGTGGTGGGGTSGGGTGGGGGTVGGGTGTLATGASSYLKAAHSGLCLSIAAGDRSDGGIVSQQACTGAPEQTWTAQAGNGGTTYVNKASGKCLDLSLLKPPAGPGTPITQWVCNGGTNQAWTQRPQNGGMALVSVNNGNLCTDVWNGSTQSGAVTAAWPCHGGANQTFLVSAAGTMPAANGQWTPIGNAAARISIGADGTLVTLNANTNVPWRYVADNNWTPLPGNFKDIAVLNANSMYAIGTDTNVYRYDGQNWTQIGTNAKAIAAADGTILIANGNNDLWLKQTDDNTNNWRQLPGKALKVAVMNRNSLWYIGTDNAVYRGDQGGNWVFVGPDTAEVAASPDGSVLVTNVNDRKMWRKTGDNTVGNWTQIDPNFQANAITIPNAQRAIVIGLDGNIYRY